MNKIERRQIYWDAYLCAMNDDIFINRDCQGVAGICDIIEHLIGVDDEDLGSLDTQKQFPEFYAQRPEHTNCYMLYWWRNDKEGWEERRQALLKAIKLTY